ncbi:MAG: SRPBCC family protein [Candidatus Dormibacteria bacterium]
MTTDRLIVTLGATVRTNATRAAVYDALADLSTHMVWGGDETGSQSFRLLTMQQPGGVAVAGTRFSSTGVVQMGTFSDETVVTESVPGARFWFRTESVMERKRAASWIGTFEHRYTLENDADDTVIRYTCAIYTRSYVPYWWKLPMKPMTKFMVQRTARHCLRSLGTVAAAQPVPAT